MTEATDQTEPNETAPETPRKRRRFLWVFLAVVLVLVTVVAGGAALMVGRPVDAPTWVREKIEARIAKDVPGIKIDFGRMTLLVQRSGLARVVLWDVDIRNTAGELVAGLSDIEAGFAPLPLLQGEVELREAQVSGAFVTLQRDADGRFGLALGDVFAEDTQAPDLPALISRIDTLLQDPLLQGLERFDADALTVRYEDLRAQRGWTADGGRLALERDQGTLRATADVALLGGGSGVASVALTASSPIGSTGMDFAFSLNDFTSGDIATQSPALAWLDELDAPISGALTSSVKDDGSLGPLSVALRIGTGVLQPNASTRPLPFDEAQTSFTFDPALGTLKFDTIAVASPLLALRATGQATMEGLDTGWPDALIGQFQFSDIHLAEGTVLDSAIRVSGAEADFRMQLEPFRLSLGRLRISDPSFPLQAKGDLVAFSDGWGVSLDAQVDRTTPAQVLEFWPKDRVPKTRTWLAENLHAGELRNVVYALRFEPGKKPRQFLDFSFVDGRLTFNKALPDVTGGAGRLTLYDGRLGLRIDGGVISPPLGGPIDIAGSEFVIPDVRQRPAQGEVALTARGALTAGLSLIDNDRWRVLSKTGRDANLASGQAEVTGRIAVPLRKGVKLPDIALNLAGRVRNVRSDTLVPGRAMRAETLQFTVTQRQVQVSGPVTLDGVAGEGTWRQPFDGGPGTVAAKVTLTPQALRSFGISLPDGMVRGRGVGDLQITLAKGRAPRFDLKSGLAGLRLAIPQIGWVLSERQTGNFRVSGSLGKPVKIDGLTLSGAGLQAVADVDLDAAGGFEALRVSALSLGNWLEARGSLVSRGRGRAPAVRVTGGRVDMRQATFGSGGGGSGGVGAPMTVALDRLQVSDNIYLTDFTGTFDTTGGLSGDFQGSVGGKARVQGRVVPQNGGTAVRVQGNDAGDILRAANLLKTVSDGTFDLNLAPVRGATGTYDGLLTIRETRLRDAPAIGALLDAISIVGLLDQLNGPGIYFTEVEARFRLSPSRVVLTRSSAVGPSMGVSMDGFYEMATGRMDMQGVLSPIYILNGIGRLIARKGEGLIGFNFNLRGTIAKPRVTVNPLSVFTPGMFRDIFRRPPPKVGE